MSGVYRYVKLTVLESKDGFLPSSKEFVINGTNADKNIALGKQCTNVVLQKDHNPNDALMEICQPIGLLIMSSFPIFDC